MVKFNQLARNVMIKMLIMEMGAHQNVKSKMVTSAQKIIKNQSAQANFVATALFKITNSAIAEAFKGTDALPTVWFWLDGNVVAPPLYAAECVEMPSEPRANSVITEIRLAALTALSTHSLLAMALKTPRHSAFTLRTTATGSLMRMSNAIIWQEKAALMSASSRRATSAKGNPQFALSAETGWWN